MTDGPDREYWIRGLRSEPGYKGPGHYLALVTAAVYLFTFSFLSRTFGWLIRSEPRPRGEGLSILAIGPFFSNNWTAAHMDALGKADLVEKISVVTPEAYDDAPNREYVIYSARLAKIFGAGIARSLSALAFAIRQRPDLIIGYHLPWNGVVALLLGRVTGSRVWYFSVGGPAEMIGGGRYSEHALFSRLREDSHFIEKRLTAVVSQFDAVLTMGSKSAAFFRRLTARDSVYPIAVGIDSRKFSENDEPGHEHARNFDLVTVGRHSKIKKVDLLFEAVARVNGRSPDVSLVLVGDGEERAGLEQLVGKLGITEAVHFAGWVDDVESYLRSSRILVMTSASEGLPHSLIESMMVGLPVVASNVGEISDLVEDHQTGFLVEPGNASAFAERIRELLDDPELLASCGKTASQRAQRYSVNGRVEAWNRIFEDLWAQGS